MKQFSDTAQRWIGAVESRHGCYVRQDWLDDKRAFIAYETTQDDIVRLRDDVQKNDPRNWALLTNKKRRGGHWGTKTWTQVRKELVDNQGDPELADIIANKAISASAGATLKPRWTGDVCGFFPIVPAAVAGDPCAMRRPTMSLSPKGSVRFFLPMFCSQGVSSQTFASIFGEVMAAIYQVRKTRPVDLVAYVCGNASLKGDDDLSSAFFLTWKMQADASDPRTLAVFSSVEVGRFAMMPIVARDVPAWCGRWPWSEFPDSPESLQRIKQAMGLREGDCLIPPLFGDRDEKCKLRRLLVEHARSMGIEMNMEENRE